MSVRSVRVRILVAAALSVLLATAAFAGRGPVELIAAQEEIPDDLRIDIGVQVFDPGLPEGPDGKVLPEVDLEAAGIFPHMRRSEGRYIAFHLRSVLEETGHWGAVRVIPKGLETVDLTITGEIKQSTGKELVLEIEAHDSTGRRWLRKKFKQQADPYAYDDQNAEEYDPYLVLYYRIANEVLAARDKLEDDEVRHVRDMSEVRFAADLAPEAYGGYFTVNKKGRYTLVRLPADDDPMIDRVQMIRERDYMFIDTLNSYYASFWESMDQPYDDWREYSYEEQVALQKMRRKAWVSGILGGLLAVAGVAADVDSTAGRVARDAAIVAGGVLVKDGIDKHQESKMHVEALRELAASFDAEIAPSLVDIEGQTLQLTGSAEAQYANWRRLLRLIFANETGLPVDINDSSTLAVGTTDN